MRKERDVAVRAWVAEYTKNSRFKLTQEDKAQLKKDLEVHALEDILDDVAELKKINSELFDV